MAIVRSSRARVEVVARIQRSGMWQSGAECRFALRTALVRAGMAAGELEPLLRRDRHGGADLRAEAVDRREPALRLHVPEGPAVARLEALRERADAVDRADRVAERDCAVGAHQRFHLALGVGELVARGDHTA